MRAGEVFHYTPPSDDYDVPEMIISIDALRTEIVRAIANEDDVTPGNITITPDLIEAINREERDEATIQKYMDNARLNDRVCFLLAFPDGSHLLADGNHRVLARHRLGFESFRAVLVSERVWKRAVVMVAASKEAHMKFSLECGDNANV